MSGTNKTNSNDDYRKEKNVPIQPMKSQFLFLSVSQSWYQVVCVLLRVRYIATRTQSRGAFKTGERKEGS